MARTLDKVRCLHPILLLTLAVTVEGWREDRVSNNHSVHYRCVSISGKPQPQQRSSAVAGCDDRAGTAQLKAQMQLEQLEKVARGQQQPSKQRASQPEQADNLPGVMSKTSSTDMLRPLGGPNGLADRYRDPDPAATEPLCPG